MKLPDLFAWVTETREGTAGIITGIIPGVSASPIPLVAISEATAKMLRDIAVSQARAAGLPARLVRYQADSLLAAE